MKASNQAIELIKNYEGLKLTPYLCSAGVPTIGYGTTSINGKRVVMDERVITPEQAIEYLQADVEKFSTELNKLIKVELAQNEFDALVSLVYNIGLEAFAKSTLLKLLNTGDYVGAGKEFLKWNKIKVEQKDSSKLNTVKFVVSKGLTTRRLNEYSIFVGNIHPI